MNTLWLTATWFNAIVDEDITALSTVRQLLIGGEALSVPHVHRALGALPDTAIINGYGPTEGTTFACWYPIPKGLARRAQSVPIGHPISNTQVYVLDERLQPTPPGVPGELCIGGDGLAIGYLEEECEARRFISDPPGFVTGGRLYRTGDRVRLLPNGELEFLGRMDRQMKIRGFRVEPEQIEHIVTEHPAVRGACVDRRRLALNGPMSLVAYVMPEVGMTIESDALRSYLSTRLPTYMMPTKVVAVAEFPRTPTGKIDLAALPDPLDSPEVEADADTPPRTDTERRIAQIWERLLKTDKIGLHRNFFELGGHSLLAVRLVSQLQSALGVSLPLAVLFECPTIAALAARIERADTGAARSTVVALRVQEEGTRFFCVPPAGSSVYHFSELVQRMGPDVSFYGIQALGLESGESPDATVEEMATRYVADIVAVQECGPYYLGGRCFGAFVAYEMARQLMAQGKDVGLLALLDPTVPPGLPYGVRYYAGRIGYFKRRGKLLYAVIRHLRARIKRFRLLWIRGIFANAPTRRLARVQRVHWRAQLTYRPEPYSGDIAFLGAQEEYHPEDTRALWKHLTTGAFEVHLVPGGHRTITEEPNLSVLARKLEQCILAVERGDGAISGCEDP